MRYSSILSNVARSVISALEWMACLQRYTTLARSGVTLECSHDAENSLRHADPAHPLLSPPRRRGRRDQRRGAHAHACSTGCARTRTAPAPRKAATRATAAPARSIVAELAERADSSARRRPATVVGGLSLRTVNACIQFLPTLDGKALFTVEDLQPHRPRRAASGAAGAGRLPRLAMRLLHAGLRDVAVDDLRAPLRGRHAADAASSWPTTCPATCAAAPATGRSSTPASACSTCRRRGSTPRRSLRCALDDGHGGLRGANPAVRVDGASGATASTRPRTPRRIRRAARARTRRRACSPARPTSACGSTSSSATWATSSTSATSTR